MKWVKIGNGHDAYWCGAQLQNGEQAFVSLASDKSFTASVAFEPTGRCVEYSRGGFKTLKAAQRWAESQIPRLRKLVEEDKKGGA